MTRTAPHPRTDSKREPTKYVEKKVRKENSCIARASAFADAALQLAASIAAAQEDKTRVKVERGQQHAQTQKKEPRRARHHEAKSRLVCIVFVVSVGLHEQPADSGRLHFDADTVADCSRHHFTGAGKGDDRQRARKIQEREGAAEEGIKTKRRALGELGCPYGGGE
ncbi:hypothetical protein DENSPDRAFT_932645 [Dentipellis sp. KUC8613]|nr:hypothetical protein DENSPDRAFT_932645 [Dentipellis sp. KUC8613]